MANAKIDAGCYIAASDSAIKNNRINLCNLGIIIGGGKNAGWTVKFDTERYPSRTIQDTAPFNNEFTSNTITHTQTPTLEGDAQSAH